MKRPHRVLLVDDDQYVRTGLRTILGSDTEIEVVGEAGDGDEVVPAVQRHSPDVVLMDLGMPRVDGIAATASVRALPDPPHVVALTTWDVDDAVLRCLEAGADGYLLKTSSPTELVKAVHAVVAGDAVLSPASTRQLLDHVRRREVDDAPRQRAREAVQALTERERGVAVLVGEGLSNRDIAARLYVSEATVKTHLASAQAKLGVDNRVRVAVIAERAGLLH